MVARQHRETDVVVIGAGPVGENVADRVVQGSLSCTIVEQDLVGGECSYWACMPSKALLRPGAALAAARRVAGADAAVSGTLDPAAVFRRRDSFTSNWDDAGQVEWLNGAGIDLLRGRATLSGRRIVVVQPEEGAPTVIEARHAVVIATGSVPSIPPIDGLDAVSFWGTREATSAHDVPPRLTVIGGGVAAVELAQAYASLGSQVVILARSGLLGRIPQPAVDLVRQGLERSGIEIRTGTTPTRVSQSATGVIRSDLADGTSIESEALLVSTGRRPATSGIGLDSLGLDPGHLEIDDTGLVGGLDGAWLYVVGDAAGKVLLTHQGKYEARATGDAIAARARGTLVDATNGWTRYRAVADDLAVPQVVFTDPEVAQVGYALEEATERYGEMLTIEVMIDVAGAGLLADGYTGWAEVVVDPTRRVIVGATFAGQDVAELLHAATIAIVGEVPLNRLWHAVPAYPTVSEVWLRLLEKLETTWRERGLPGDPFLP